MLKSINYNYKKSEEPIRTMYQATEDLILMKQYKKDIQKYYEDFKTLNNVVQELNKSKHGSPFIDIICHERGDDPVTLTPEEKVACIKEEEERMLAMQLVINADPDKYGSLIESYD